jgi:CubicO group peptidase (beta-lactamase class C family)
MALTEKNIIGLDEFAADYVPAFKQGKLAEITFRMLMSHSTGLPMIDGEGQALLDPEITLMESATIIAKTYPLQFAPGQGFTYTEIGFQVVGAAMEAATGRSLQSLVRHYITGPIGMNDTHVSADPAHTCSTVVTHVRYM